LLKIFRTFRPNFKELFLLVQIVQKIQIRDIIRKKILFHPVLNALFWSSSMFCFLSVFFISGSGGKDELFRGKLWIFGGNPLESHFLTPIPLLSLMRKNTFTPSSIKDFLQILKICFFQI